MCEPVPIGARSGSAATPARESVADGVFVYGESGVAAEAFDISAGAQVGFAEDNARDDRRLGCGDLRERMRVRR